MSGMVCPRCAKQNEDGASFCSRCGLDFSKVDMNPKFGDDDPKYCYRHPKRATNLSCGRCDKPICEDCVVIGPAGPRCPECAKSNVPFRPAAVGLEFKRMFRSLTKVSPWYLIIGFFVLSGVVRGCFAVMDTPREVEIPQEVPVEVLENGGSRVVVPEDEGM